MKNTIGGTAALRYSFNIARRTGISASLQALHSKNTCKSCAFGTGGQKGGMRNEAGQFPEFCKKNLQAQLTDLQAAILESVFEQNSIEQLKQLSGRELEQLGRITQPLYKQAGDSHFSTLTMDAALDKLLQRFQQSDPQRSFFYSSGRSSNEAAFLLQLFARAWGSNHVNNCSYYCHQASGVGLTNTIGTGTATLQLHDLKQSDLIFVIGANPASNHPRFIKELVACRRRGGQVIVINPVKEAGLVNFTLPSDVRSMLGGGSEVASLYLQPNIGTDIAVLKGIAKAYLETNGQQHDFIKQSTQGFAQYAADLQATSWDEITTQSGLKQKLLAQVADIYQHAKQAVFAWGMGVTQHLHGVENIESIANLALMGGMIGKQGAGLLPLRGHSNVQGVGSVGVVPELKAAVLKNIETHLGIPIPKSKGLDTLACLQAAHHNKMDFALLLGGNLFAASPDPHFTEAALNKIAFKVHLHPTLNKGHVYASDGEVLILPIAVRDEEKQATTQESMFNYVRISDGGIKRFPKLLSEADIITQLASQLIPKRVFDFSIFSHYANIRIAIAKTIPGFEAIHQADKDRTEFQVQGRTLHNTQFPTPSGKAQFQVIAIPATQHNKQHIYQMSTIRSEGQFNTIIYEEEDIYRKQTERWVVLMNAHDMRREGLGKQSRVTLKNNTGRMVDLKVGCCDIAAGNLLTYFPEANVLVPMDCDPRSKTPSFKSVQVELIK